MTQIEESDDALPAGSTVLKELDTIKAESYNVIHTPDIDSAVQKLDIVIRGMETWLKHGIYQLPSGNEAAIWSLKPWQEMVDNMFDALNGVTTARACLRKFPPLSQDELDEVEHFGDHLHSTAKLAVECRWWDLSFFKEDTVTF